MRYLVLASDYDGTLVHDGRIDEDTLAAVKRLRASGRRFVLVTGRELEELIGTFPQIGVCDQVVAENGALLYTPATREVRVLAPPPPATFVEELKQRGVGPISVGRSIVATWEPHQETVLQTIRDQGLELQVIFNKGAVMILPSGVNKATGLAAALHAMALSRHNVVAVGDAENDHAFLSTCECAVAVSNALPALKERADLVTQGARGAGVAELIDHMIKTDLVELEGDLSRHHILLGTDETGAEVRLPTYDLGVMICGTSGGGKSTVTSGLLERLCKAGYQFFVIDPEGDYTALECAIVLGTPQRAPLIEEVISFLVRDPGQNAVVNLLGVALDHRPAFVAELLPRLLELRSKTGRPHWLVFDEAHHLVPPAREAAAPSLPATLKGVLHITVHPGTVARTALEAVDHVLVAGDHPERTLAEVCSTLGLQTPSCPPVERLTPGDVLLWRRGTPTTVLVHTEPPHSERKRHSRKYAEGNLGPDRSFFFRGPAGKLNLRAQNLAMFVQLAEGVDEETWQFHRQAGDFSRWFREFVKDRELADEVAAIEKDGLGARESIGAVRAAIERRYTLPDDAPSGT